jgi:hypothetical protein
LRANFDGALGSLFHSSNHFTEPRFCNEGNFDFLCNIDGISGRRHYSINISVIYNLNQEENEQLKTLNYNKMLQQNVI